MRLNVVGDQVPVCAGSSCCKSVPVSRISDVSQFETDSNCNLKFEDRLKKAYAKLSQLTLMERKRKLFCSAQTSIQTLIFPIFAHGCEAWNFNRDSFDKLPVSNFTRTDVRLE